MSDDTDKQGSGDRSRISLSQEHEVDYWTRTLGVTEDELRNTVASVGNMAADVRARLKK